jgi:hypothetical protein
MVTMSASPLAIRLASMAMPHRAPGSHRHRMLDAPRRSVEAQCDHEPRPGHFPVGASPLAAFNRFNRLP